MDVRFVIVAPPPARKSFKMRLPVVVGRGDEAKFRIQQDSVSRRHCEFTFADGVVTVTDLGSTNGTLVAGTRIAAHAATAVPSGAEVRIGGTVLRVEYAAPRGAAVAAAAPHEADTVPLPAAAEPPEPEPVPELEPVGETAAAVDAAAATGEAVAADPAEIPAFPAVDPAPPPADGSFEFLAADAAPPPAEGSFDFLAADAAPPPAADDTLDDFFKSLS